METQTGDVNKLSELYSQLDELTPAEKWKAIDYLVKSLIAAIDENISVEVSTKSGEKTSTEVVQKAEELTNLISEPQGPDNKKIEIADEHVEKLTTEDCDIYIHWNPRWHQVFWEQKKWDKDTLLAMCHFDRYSNHTENLDLKNVQIFARDLWSLWIEYTITKPSCEVSSYRSWGYIWLTFVLKNWYKVNDTWELPPWGIRKDYDWKNTNVGELMNKFMQFLIKSCYLTEKHGYNNLVQRKTYDKDLVEKVILEVKDVFIQSMNEFDGNKGLIIRNNS